MNNIVVNNKNNNNKKEVSELVNFFFLLNVINHFYENNYIYKEFNDGGLTVQYNFEHTVNQNILNCHVN